MGGACGRRDRLLAPVRAMLAAPGLFSMLSGVPVTAQTPLAQSPSATASQSAAPCELHIWPAGTAHTTFQGWFYAGAVDGARRGIKGYPDQHADALDSERQARLLATIDWRGAFSDPTLVVIVHPAPTGSNDDRARTSRLVAAGSSPCYRELIIDSAIVESEVFTKQSVRVLALRKRFDGAGSAPANFSSMSEAAIHIPDADKAAKDSGARTDAALQAAFVSAVDKFAVMQSFH